MKKQILWTIMFAGCSFTGFSQVLLEDKQGDQIANNAPVYTQTAGADRGINTVLIKLNTGDQSLGFDYIVSSKSFDPSNYRIHEFSVKAKPTDGAAAVLNNGQFSPGLKFNYSLTQVSLFADQSAFTDWGGVTIAYVIDKYSLYKKDLAFAGQVYSQSFKGLSIALNYNALIKSRWIFNAHFGYARTSNYGALNTVNIQDISSITDPETMVIRQTVKSKTAKEGVYKEGDSYPLMIALTKATTTDAPGSASVAKLRLGYTVYLKSIMSAGKPETNAGLLFFLTKQNKSGIRAPVFGLDVQAQDPFDVHRVNNGLQNRLAIGFTTVFTL
ncbi:hypothetical protein [Mucilaginibacter ginsenosidivorans]|uniref:Uncharacterized protein n=1 Tax=Mucilaginibacter ginsenosidivorans TaxID=398053 RepID=A0A5B8UVN2_9SPHI|nr:hypothetical protein [Mucilaginibacter ginsenosidivorans]QEC62496.1 hypothetical protein FRZ54_07810 [Mucilaginibacter ginsenosidivorans]